MKQIIYTLILVFGFGFSVFGQTEKLPCPSVDVSGGGVAQPGERMSFTVSVVGEAANSNLEYEWTVSQGAIVQGQGTASITVDTTGLSEPSLTATVEVKGLPENCLNTDSEYSPYCPPRRPELIDEFGKLRDGEVRSRMEAIYLKLADEPNSQGYIINYGTDKEIAVRETQIRKAIIFRKYDASRITLVRGGASSNGGVYTRVWTVAPGVENPTPDM